MPEKIEDGTAIHLLIAWVQYRDRAHREDESRDAIRLADDTLGKVILDAAIRLDQRRKELSYG